MAPRNAHSLLLTALSAGPEAVRILSVGENFLGSRRAEPIAYAGPDIVDGVYTKPARGIPAAIEVRVPDELVQNIKGPAEQIDLYLLVRVDRRLVDLILNPPLIVTPGQVMAETQGRGLVGPN